MEGWSESEGGIGVAGKGFSQYFYFVLQVLGRQKNLEEPSLFD